MGNRVTEAASATTMSERGAEPEDDDGLGGPGQDSKTSLPDSDASEVTPSNVAGTTLPDWSAVARSSDLKGRRRILIVDDEIAIADTLELIFRMQRYDARVAYSAELAVEVIAAWQPELAVLDVILPEMNGIDLAIVIKENYPKCHIILFSGHSNTSMLLEEAGKKGHNFEVLPKPVQPDVMLERAAELLGPSGVAAYN